MSAEEEKIKIMQEEASSFCQKYHSCMTPRFSKKVQIYVKYIEKYYDGYLPNEDGFPFAICHIKDQWKIVNKISGIYLGFCSFRTKKDAEVAFLLFEANHNIQDIEWFDPLPDIETEIQFYHRKGFDTINRYNFLKYEEVNR